MLDEYGLRLLAEMGIEVHLPRLARGMVPEAENAGAAEPVGSLGEPAAGRHGADLLIIGAGDTPGRLVDDLLRAFRLVGLRPALSGAADAAALADARGLVVLGEALARRLGADMPAQRHQAIQWIVASEATALATSAAAKRSLWGEMKRLSRTLHGSSALH